MKKKDQFDYLLKIVIVGDSEVGKTNLLSRFVENTFNIDSKTTIGVQFATKTISIDNKLIKSQIWDTAGQQKFKSITNAYYRNAVGSIIVFDLTKTISFQNVQLWYDKLKQYGDPDIKIMLLGNKTDLKRRQVKVQTVEKYAKDNNFLYAETSALTGQNVQNAFQMLIKGIYDQVKLLPDITPDPVYQGLKRTQSISVYVQNQQKVNGIESNNFDEVKLANPKKQQDKKNKCCK